ncbi:hypothetical protein [Tychonema sp. BBK16]|uniref:hypothetical protein n=1 Tax=Tychonema sp. BBK16 TaxID=2699888 RepID=UPI001F294958|nr:hypothetical protein [Tychonema sp. BBK16]MCF6373811.1 hypothetical protein [Tychonema sp. BBK16]
MLYFKVGYPSDLRPIIKTRSRSRIGVLLTRPQFLGNCQRDARIVPDRQKIQLIPEKYTSKQTWNFRNLAIA